MTASSQPIEGAVSYVNRIVSARPIGVSGLQRPLLRHGGFIGDLCTALTPRYALVSGRHDMPRKKKIQPSAPLLRWIPAKGLKRTYQLHAANETLGCIRWPKLFGSLAEAEYRGCRWTFKRGGFLRPHVTVREESSEVDLGILELSWGGSGLLKIRDGARFRWERLGFWSRRFFFTDEDGVELVAFEPTFGLLRRTGAVESHGEIGKMPEFGLLVTLGWYVIMLIADDEAASVAVIATMSSSNGMEALYDCGADRRVWAGVHGLYSFVFRLFPAFRDAASPGDLRSWAAQ